MTAAATTTRRRLAVMVLLTAAGCMGNITGTPDEGQGGTGGGMRPPGMTGGAPGVGGAGPGPGGRAGAGGGMVTPPGTGGATGGNGGADPPAPGAVRNQCEGVMGEVAGPRLLRRLTGPEFEATVRAVFGFDAAAWTGPSLPPDPASGNGFTNNADRLGVGGTYARGLQDTAKDVADRVVGDAHLARVLPCAAAGADACATTYLDTVGARLYRRPLSAPEKMRYMALYTKVRRAGDFKSWVYWATVALLQSPHSVYRSEIGDLMSAGRYKLTPYETAAALAYTYTGGPPDATLTQLAATNRLATADQIEAAARQLVLDPAGKPRPAFQEQVMRFADQWLGLSPLANLKKSFADFVPAVQASVGEETRRFVGAVVFEDRGKPADLMTAPYTLVDATLTRYYKFGAATGTTFVRAMRPPGWGVGLLAQGSILAIAAGNVSTSPTKRGHLVRSRILCQEVPPPPPVVNELPPPTAAQTTRQRYEVLHVADPSCRACHRIMDPIGFGLEHLDASGRYRAKEGAFDIDDRGEVVNTSAGNLTFTGPTELAQALGRLPEYSDCMAAFISSHAFGMDHHDTPCMVRTAADELRRGTLSLLDFYIRMARSERFRTRTP